jgi:hypothetical protein
VLAQRRQSRNAAKAEPAIMNAEATITSELGKCPISAAGNWRPTCQCRHAAAAKQNAPYAMRM